MSDALACCKRFKRRVTEAEINQQRVMWTIGGERTLYSKQGRRRVAQLLALNLETLSHVSVLEEVG